MKGLDRIPAAKATLFANPVSSYENGAYEFQIFFSDGRPEAPESVYERVNNTYFRVLREYLHYSDEELSKARDIIFDAPKVRYIVELVQGMSFTASEHDIMGEFFEGIVRGEFKQSKGQYLTHLSLVGFMVEALQLPKLALDLINSEKRLSYIIGPACGSDSFLIESMKRITHRIMSNSSAIRKAAFVQEFVQLSFPSLRRNSWAREYIYGIEINCDLATAAKVNMVGNCSPPCAGEPAGLCGARNGRWMLTGAARRDSRLE